MGNEFLTVLTAMDKKSDADGLARMLVERRLAGCVQVLGPMESTYRWKGKVETAQEWLCVIKCRAAGYQAVEKAIKEVHPYETPEIIALPIVKGSREYLGWLGEATEAEA